MTLLAALAALALAQTAQPAHAAPTLPPLTEATKPQRLAGTGVNVYDIEKVRAFYVDVLGMKVIQRIPAQGAVREYILSFNAEVDDGPVLILTKMAKPPAAKREPGGRIVFAVPNGAALARRAAQAGYPAERIVEGSNTIIDPEGHRIQLFQSAPAPGAK